MTDNKEFGKKGEELAAKYLSRRGYRILEKNYRAKAGEIDIVAMEGGALVFVEVKSRRDESFGAPELAVNSHKQRQMTRAALTYLIDRRKPETPCRFDVVCINALGGGEPRVTIIKNAFEMSGGY